MKVLYTLLLLSCCHLLAAQDLYTISGYVQDAESSEKLISAKVYDSRSAKGALTNNFGFFSLTLPAGSVSLTVAYAGYKPFKLELDLQQDSEFTFDLEFYSTDEVTIVADEVERIQDKTEMSTIDVPIEQIKLLPALLGEVDVIKAIQLLPGVQSGNEGTTGLYVRGGGPDQNLILLDDVPLYYVSHLGGFFSVFNADALSSVKLVKGGFPSRYGGRLSSVLDIRMKDGNAEKFQGEGSLGLIASHISLQGPIIKNKTSFMVSARRTYLDLFTRPLTSLITRLQSGGETNASFGYYFYDVNAKINHKISHKDRLLVSFYMGDDRLGLSLSDQFGEPGQPDYNAFSLKNTNAWGNRLGAVRWNHIWNPKLFSNLTATYTNYRLKTDNDISTEFDNGAGGVESIGAALRYRSGIRDFGAKLEFDYYPNPQHSIKFGGNMTYHTFTPGQAGFQISVGDTALIDTTLNNLIQNTWESYVFVEDNFRLGSRFSGNVGLHISLLRVNQKSYPSLQPRVSLRYLLSEDVSIKASYARMTQFLHLLVNSGTGLPIDLWVPATDKVPPQNSWQAALGIASSIFDDKFEFTVEGYYKKMTGLIAYKEGTDFYIGLDGSDWQDRVETGGEGEAYGVEVLLQKKTGKTTGWIGYTLSWNNRIFENLNQGEVFPYKYDRRHDVSVVIAHQLSERVSFSATWVYGTGNAISLPSGGYNTLPVRPTIDRGFTPRFGTFYPLLNGQQGVQLYENGRNGFRMQAYHRMDLGMNVKRPTKWGSLTWNFGVYNIYNRLNPYAYFIGTDDEKTLPDGSPQPALIKLSLFPIIPSISLSFKF
ncbi:MAG: carboxypeptidase-like regulatory domain-containing protein [Bacteroidia bacterium]